VLAQRQGAKGVLATLWPVADQSTAIFMQELYRSRQEKHLTKAEALRDSQLALINGTHKLPKGLKALPAANNTSKTNAPTFTPNPAKPYAHPYYWAPFILMGNWL
jgi:CHAT domain-containing protein